MASMYQLGVGRRMNQTKTNQGRGACAGSTRSWLRDSNKKIRSEKKGKLISLLVVTIIVGVLAFAFSYGFAKALDFFYDITEDRFSFIVIVSTIVFTACGVIEAAKTLYSKI
ncbi:hypothetical protein [Pelagicoccus sp. SDUM812002]|uniref:hypothetical protein n=1 Tax=Pelagicoccus sp. SDUM812002 TaxID=3041266 RepID=UPI00280E778B|nr:hypothetical protein [Pelagicoccus sp. SDUM812002]MDQ8188575.1 hypothetical protein [Pelagicoccus sp. SDUM812002]